MKQTEDRENSLSRENELTMAGREEGNSERDVSNSQESSSSPSKEAVKIGMKKYGEAYKDSSINPTIDAVEEACTATAEHMQLFFNPLSKDLRDKIQKEARAEGKADTLKWCLDLLLKDTKGGHHAVRQIEKELKMIEDCGCYKDKYCKKHCGDSEDPSKNLMSTEGYQIQDAVKVGMELRCNGCKYICRLCARKRLKATAECMQNHNHSVRLELAKQVRKQAEARAEGRSSMLEKIKICEEEHSSHCVYDCLEKELKKHE